MKRMYYDNIGLEDVIESEHLPYELHQKAFSEFKKMVSLYGCTVKISDFWTSVHAENPTDTRPNWENGYRYWISYDVLFNCEPVIYDDENSAMSRWYNIMLIKKLNKFHHHKYVIEIYDDVTDVYEETAEDLNILKSLFSQNNK